MAEVVSIAPDRGRSPLQEQQESFRARSLAAKDAVMVREIPFVTKINLRGDPDNPAFRRGAQGALGIDLPTKPNTTVSGPSLSALWLGPDEWLIVREPGSDGRLVAQLQKAVAGLHVSVVDVSDARTVIEIAGARAREVLEKGCSLDLHPRAFEPGRCAQTQLGRATVILQRLETEPAWRVYVLASFAEYLAAWLLDAMGEYCAD